MMTPKMAIDEFISTRGETTTMSNLLARHQAIARKLFVPLALALSLSACSTTMAQTRYNDVPVLVVAEDEDKTTVRRGSDIFKRVIAQLSHSMKRTGFRMVDEGSVSVDLGWRIRDRRKKTELIRLAKLMSKSGKATHQVRAMVLFRIHASIPDNSDTKGGANSVQVRIDGEIYDILANEFIDTYEMPRTEYPAPAKCNNLCVSEVVGDRARDIAGSLGVVLAKKLARYRDASAGGSGSARKGKAVTGDARRRGAASGHTMQIPYTLTLRYFDRQEALTIIGVMADEFPGYKTHTLITQEPALRRYSYITTAKPHKMEEWLTILLKDMNFNPDKEVVILIKGSEITVEKIVPTPARPRSKDEKVRFK